MQNILIILTDKTGLTCFQFLNSMAKDYKINVRKEKLIAANLFAQENPSIYKQINTCQ